MDKINFQPAANLQPRNPSLHKKILVVDAGPTEQLQIGGSNRTDDLVNLLKGLPPMALSGGLTDNAASTQDVPTVQESIAKLEEAGVEVKAHTSPSSLLHRKMLVIDGQEWLSPDAKVGGDSKDAIIGSFNRSSIYTDNPYFTSNADFRLSEFSDVTQHETGHGLLSGMNYSPSSLADTKAEFDKLFQGVPFDNGPTIDPKTGAMNFYYHGNGAPPETSLDILTHENYDPYKKQA